MLSPTLSRITLVAFVTFLAACGGGGDSSGDSASGSSAESEATTPTGSASVSGTISFAGTAPEMSAMRLDRECMDMHGGEQVMSNAVVVNDGKLKNVFVRISDGLPAGYNFGTPTEEVVFDQSGCMYEPHVFGIQTGQTLRILNSDPFLHNIQAQASENRPFNIGMPNQGDERERSFVVPEVMLPIKCDVHPWMSAFAGVVDHPFFAVSSEDGSFSIGDLPAGTYTIEAWHEEYGSSTHTVTVGEGEGATVDFTFGPDAT